MAKGGRGKRKIAIARIVDKNSRQVTFTKRRDGLFKKCSEISSSFPGTQFAVITFSVAGKPFCHGYPCVDTVLDRFRKDTGDCGGEVEVDNGEVVDECPWWERSPDGMSLEELEEFKSALEGLKAEVEARVSSLSSSVAVVDDDVVKEGSGQEWVNNNLSSSEEDEEDYTLAVDELLKMEMDFMKSIVTPQF